MYGNGLDRHQHHPASISIIHKATQIGLDEALSHAQRCGWYMRDGADPMILR